MCRLIWIRRISANIYFTRILFETSVKKECRKPVSCTFFLHSFYISFSACFAVSAHEFLLTKQVSSLSTLQSCQRAVIRASRASFRFLIMNFFFCRNVFCFFFLYAEYHFRICFPVFSKVIISKTQNLYKYPYHGM